MSEGIQQTSDTADREITVSRLFDAPRELVFAMWTDPEHIGNWFGLNGFTTTTHEMDVRPGGVWRHTMRGPDGNEFPNQIIYREVVKPERLVYSHVSPPPFQMTVIFAAAGSQTRLTAHMLFETAALRDRTIKQFGADEGLRQTLQRLNQAVTKLAAENHPLGATVMPHLSLRDGNAAVAFYEQAFGATLMYKMPAEDGKRLLHAALALNGGVIMLADEFPEFNVSGPKAPPTIGGSPVTIHLEVDDADRWWKRAINAGAVAVMPLDNMFWGARYGMLKDPFGHFWSIGSPLK
jgi:uncharacterized glyoxalase superfamily protein PhnB/uncharacterized protein YndB with AHSA1/START domain